MPVRGLTFLLLPVMLLQDVNSRSCGNHRITRMFNMCSNHNMFGINSHKLTEWMSLYPHPRLITAHRIRYNSHVSPSGRKPLLCLRPLATFERFKSQKTKHDPLLTDKPKLNFEEFASSTPSAGTHALLFATNQK